MAKRSWIILIDQKPKGPFSEAEVLGLIDKGSVMRTHLAFEVRSNSLTPEWKFLWQFPEFDRRAHESKDKKDSFSTQRKPLSESERRDKVLRGVPERQLRTSPDRIVQSTAAEKLGRKAIDPVQREHRRAFSIAWVVAGITFTWIAATSFRSVTQERDPASRGSSSANRPGFLPPPSRDDAIEIPGPRAGQQPRGGMSFDSGPGVRPVPPAELEREKMRAMTPEERRDYVIKRREENRQEFLKSRNERIAREKRDREWRGMSSQAKADMLEKHATTPKYRYNPEDAAKFFESQQPRRLK